MSRLMKATFSLLLIVLFGLPLHAQEIQRVTPLDNPVEPSPTPTQRQALARLDQLLETSGNFADAQLKLKIQAEIADVLWPHDEPRARRMFAEAFRDIGEMKLPHPEAESASPQFMATLASHSRTEMLRMISRHDQKLAENLAKSIAQPQPNKPEPSACIGCRNQNESDTQKLRLALGTIDTAPARAAQLAKEGVSKGINPAINSVLFQMRRKDPALADELFVYALAVARRDSIYLSDSFGSLYSYALPELGKAIVKAAIPPQATTPANPAMIAEFLHFVHDVILREAEALQTHEARMPDPQANRRIVYDYFIGEKTLVYFERYMPDKTAAVRARLEDLLRRVPPDTARQYLADFSREHTPAATSKQAATETDSETQQRLYQQAIIQALNAQDYDQALALLPKLDDETARFYFESQVRHQRAMVAINKREVDAAYEFASGVPNLSVRASLFGRIALQLFYDEDTTRATKMLTEAEALFAKAESGIEKAQGMLELVYTAAQIDLGRGFEDMRLAIDAINAAGFAPQWTSFQALINQKTGKPFMRTDVGIGTLHFDMGFGQLARRDFARSLQLVQMIASNEVSVVAQLALCRIAVAQMPVIKPQEKVREKAKEAAKPDPSSKPQPPEQKSAEKN